MKVVQDHLREEQSGSTIALNNTDRRSKLADPCIADRVMRQGIVSAHGKESCSALSLFQPSPTKNNLLVTDLRYDNRLILLTKKKQIYH
jgi:hypothetical protein